jgi:hypothetical protein
MKWPLEQAFHFSKKGNKMFPFVSQCLLLKGKFIQFVMPFKTFSLRVDCVCEMRSLRVDAVKHKIIWVYSLRICFPRFDVGKSVKFM